MNEVTGDTEVLRNLEALQNRMRVAVHDAADEIGHLLANDAKTHHDWQPITGATDVSTKGEIVEETREFVLVALHAGTHYSVWLELARAGRWAWLWPTVERNKRNMMLILKRHLQGAMQ